MLAGPGGPAADVLAALPGAGLTTVHFCSSGDAGRDRGNLGFERAAAEHARLMAAGCRALGASAVELAVTVLDPRFEGLLAAVDVPVRPFPDREGGRGWYYEGLCFEGVRVLRR